MSWEATIAAVSLFYMIVSGVIGWWTKSISTSQRTVSDNQSQLARDMRNLELLLPNEYVKKTDLDQRLSRMEHTLDLIITKLDRKADKE